MLISTVAVIIALIGLILYFAVPHAKWSNIGFALFCIGTFVQVLVSGQKTTTLF